MDHQKDEKAALRKKQKQKTTTATTKTKTNKQTTKQSIQLR